MIAQPTPPLKRWIAKSFPGSPDERRAIESLTTSLGVSPFLATLLVQRGVRTFEEARAFFRPEISHLHDPFLMKNMDRAVARLQMALAGQEKILIYGDYDVDGTTSVALVYGFLRNHHPHIDYYIPDRYKEGYGISRQGVQWAAEQGFSLIIALDCGIKSVERVAEASRLGVDFIICDHHRPGQKLPDAAAILDPKCDDCPYPYKELSGCGVGFKLLQAFCLTNNIPLDGLYGYLDLVAVSIASDIVPITGENRIMTHYGLKVLNSTPRTGLKALINVAGFKNKNDLDITNVVFGIGPRINAAGRIQHAKAAVQLLLADHDDEADNFAMAINKHNNDRRTFDTSMTEQALDMIRQNETLLNAKSTVLFDASWHKGVVGIVASRCIEHFHRPTIILTQSNDKAAGSARSVPGFDVYEAIEACADLLEQFGGHTFAAGMTLPVDNVEAFRQKFEEVVSQTIKDEHLTPLIDIDLPLDFSEIDARMCRVLKQMGPFGPHNMQPVFMTENVYLVGEPIIMKEKHLKIQVRQTRTGHAHWAVGFGMAHLAEHIQPGMPFSICYHPDLNTYNGDTRIQLMLKDIRVA